MNHAPKKTVEVRINPDLHPGRTPEDERQRLVWEVLDTTWGLLSEYASRIAVLTLRDGLKEQGADFPTDEELFSAAIESGDPRVLKSYADMVMADVLAGEALEAAFERMQEVALKSTADAFGVTIVEDEADL